MKFFWNVGDPIGEPRIRKPFVSSYIWEFFVE